MSENHLMGIPGLPYFPQLLMFHYVVYFPQSKLELVRLCSELECREIGCCFPYCHILKKVGSNDIHF